MDGGSSVFMIPNVSTRVGLHMCNKEKGHRCEAYHILEMMSRWSHHNKRLTHFFTCYVVFLTSKKAFFVTYNKIIKIRGNTKTSNTEGVRQNSTTKPRPSPKSLQFCSVNFSAQLFHQPGEKGFTWIRVGQEIQLTRRDVLVFLAVNYWEDCIECLIIQGFLYQIIIVKHQLKLLNVILPFYHKVLHKSVLPQRPWD